MGKSQRVFDKLRNTRLLWFKRGLKPGKPSQVLGQLRAKLKKEGENSVWCRNHNPSFHHSVRIATLTWKPYYLLDYQKPQQKVIEFFLI